MRIAFVYDRINKFGGAERILLTLHEIWPNAPIYTGIYDAKKASWSKIFEIKPSFLKYFPFIKTKHEIFPTLTPYAFEVMVFDSYDVVLTITSSDAKGIITKPQTLHICYCLTPTRYLWSGYRDYLEQPGLGIINPLARHLMRSLFTKLRYWDNIASLRPDYYFSISKNVARRIKKYYHHNSIVIYPPVEEKVFKYNRKSHSKDYYLVVSRLVPYKKIDYVINAFNKIGLRLIIIGKGIDENRLSKEAKPNIEFIKRDLTDRELCCYYQGCRALIFPGEEDFGLTAVEVQACGRPVIAYKSGGICETVVSGETGEFYERQDVDSLLDALSKFNKKHYSSFKCTQNARRFSKSQFINNMRKSVNKIWIKYKKNI